MHVKRAESRDPSVCSLALRGVRRGDLVGPRTAFFINGHWAWEGAVNINILIQDLVE